MQSVCGCEQTDTEVSQEDKGRITWTAVPRPSGCIFHRRLWCQGPEGRARSRAAPVRAAGVTPKQSRASDAWAPRTVLLAASTAAPVGPGAARATAPWGTAYNAGRHLCNANSAGMHVQTLEARPPPLRTALRVRQRDPTGCGCCRTPCGSTPVALWEQQSTPDKATQLSCATEPPVSTRTVILATSERLDTAMTRGPGGCSTANTPDQHGTSDWEGRERGSDKNSLQSWRLEPPRALGTQVPACLTAGRRVKDYAKTSIYYYLVHQVSDSLETVPLSFFLLASFGTGISCAGPTTAFWKPVTCVLSSGSQLQSDLPQDAAYLWVSPTFDWDI